MFCISYSLTFFIQQGNLEPIFHYIQLYRHQEVHLNTPVSLEPGEDPLLTAILSWPGREISSSAPSFQL